MRYAFLSLVAVLAIGCTSPKPTVEILRPAYLDAIKPIQVQQANASEEFLVHLYRQGWEPAEGEEYINICTAGSINREQHLWLTAAHCVRDIGPEGRYINQLPLTLVDVQFELDVAVVKVDGFTAKELLMQITPPRWGQELLVAGHPFGYPDIFVTRGTIANPLVVLSNKRFMIFDVAGAPGNSGSPVLNLKGEMVSVLQIGWGRDFSPVTGGAPYVTLLTLAHHFTPRTDKVY